jgi:putative endonuclease
MYTVYIIYSAKLDRFYTGYSESIEKRLQEHKSGLSSFTSKADDWILKYQHNYPSRQEAHKAELLIKSKKSRKYIEWLISMQD